MYAFCESPHDALLWVASESPLWRLMTPAHCLRDVAKLALRSKCFLACHSHGQADKPETHNPKPKLYVSVCVCLCVFMRALMNDSVSCCSASFVTLLSSSEVIKGNDIWARTFVFELMFEPRHWGEVFWITRVATHRRIVSG